LKALLQRVTRAAVSIAGKPGGQIATGLVVLVGVATGDTDKDVDYLAQKAMNLRIFPDANGRFNLSVLDIKGELLLVSQFTLLANTRKGRRPSFIEAAPPTEAKALFQRFVTQIQDSGLKVATGCFQQHMQVEIHNDGPVTVMIDSREKYEK